MKLKRIISAAAAALIAAMQLPVYTAFADSESIDDELTDGTFTFEMVDGGYKIIACDSSAIITEIPAMRNGYAIVEIGDQAFAGCTFISELKIPDTVKTMGYYSFGGCTALEKVTLPDSLTEIPFGAFAACENLKEIIIPEGVTTIGDAAFSQCVAATTLELPDSLTMIGNGSFEYCYSIKEINLPENLSYIGDQAFLNCPSVEKITADGNEVFTVEDNILYDKAKTTLYHAAAYNIPADFYVPDTVTDIADGAFSYCTGLEKIFFPSSVTSIGQEAFLFCMELSHIDFSEGLVEIGTSAFAQCTSLTSIDLPTTLMTIGDGAFFFDTALEQVIIPEGLQTIGAGSFAGCTSLMNIIVPGSVGSVGEYAFGYNQNSEGTYDLIDGFSMSVKSGSAAEDYAEDNDIEHTVSDKSLAGMAFLIIGAGFLAAAAVFAVVLMRRGKKGASAEVKAEQKAEADYLEENDPSYKGITDDSAEDDSEETETDSDAEEESSDDDEITE